MRRLALKRGLRRHLASMRARRRLEDALSGVRGLIPASSAMRATSARAASAAPQGRPAPPPSSPPSSAALPRCARRALALRPRCLRGAAPLSTAPRPSARPPRASSPRTSGSVTAEYARSPYQTPHLAGASAPGWSTLTGGSEHVGPHVFFYSTTPRLTSLPALDSTHASESRCSRARASTRAV